MAPEERRFAVLIGSSEYRDDSGISNLRCPPADVEGMYELLTSPETGMFPRETTHRLVNRPHYDIMRFIAGLCKRARRDDVLLIYYSGHGKQDAVGRLYLTTTDTSVDTLEGSSLALDTLRNILDLSFSRKIIMVLDCCFSGAASVSFLRGSADDQLKTFARAQGTYLLTASTRFQPAEEKEGDKYAVFTKHLIAGVRSGNADMNRDGFVSMDELFAYVHRNVTFESRQEPERYFMGGRGELVFARSPPLPLGGEAAASPVSQGIAFERNLKLFETWRMGPSGAAVTAVAVSAREVFGAAGDEAGSVHVFNLRDGVIRDRTGGGAPVWGLAFSPSGDHIAWIDGGSQVNIYHLGTHSSRTTRIEDVRALTEIAFVDGNFLAVCSRDGMLVILDMRDGTLARHPLLGGSVTSMAVHYESKLICIGASPNRLSLFNAATANFEFDMETPWPRPSSLAFLASSQALACGEADGRVRIVDLFTRSSVTEVGSSRGAVSALSFHPQTNLLFVCDGSHLVTVTDTSNWRVLGRFRQNQRVTALASGPARGFVMLGFIDGSVTLLRRYLSARAPLFAVPENAHRTPTREGS